MYPLARYNPVWKRYFRKCIIHGDSRWWGFPCAALRAGLKYSGGARRGRIRWCVTHDNTLLGCDVAPSVHWIPCCFKWGLITLWKILPNTFQFHKENSSTLWESFVPCFHENSGCHDWLIKTRFNLNYERHRSIIDELGLRVTSFECHYLCNAMRSCNVHVCNVFIFWSIRRTRPTQTLRWI